MYNANQSELDILKYWEEHKVFEKSVSERPENKPYVFYDGPPFATGLPHYGHILGSVIKDVVPRYWTMKGYRVRRRWGWDCHGLPIENLVEKELKISGKKQIEEMIGVEKFNETCRSKVLLYTKEWKKMVSRIGRWVEFDNAYKTMDSTYMESVWWALKTLWDRGLIYEGRKVLMYCPHCETPVSKAEVAMDNSYKDIEEETVTVKFKIKNPGKHGLPENAFILAWTTTPWTLPGNIALAVGENIKYVIAKLQHIPAYADGTYIMSEEYYNKIFHDAIIEHNLDQPVPNSDARYLLGKDLLGIEYEPLFDVPAVRNSGKKAWYVTSADFVTTDEGTGVVHTAVIYGEDDYNLGLKIDLPMVPLLDYKGVFNSDAPDLIRGAYFKKTEDAIKNDLENRGLMFKRERHTHSYPHCWRCDTQLFYNAISAWFINIQKVKQRMIELNEKVNWFPEHLKHGRFLNILDTAPDWNISRNRYWATPLPFWKCDNENCKHVECVGSIKELKEKALNFNDVYLTDKVEEVDLHKHLADKIKIKCAKCSGAASRVVEVIDCWVESASMPFAEFHFPFENDEAFKERFPGQYIGEYIAQTRAWFYYMHAIAVLLFDNISFENVVCTGTILNDKGDKLSKSKMNFTDPWIIIEQFGVDALRYYMMTSVVMQADNLFFNDREVKEVYNKVINILWNVVEFYKMYADEGVSLPAGEAGNKEKGVSENVLDKWILVKLNVLIKDVTDGMDKYDTVKAARPIKDFIDDLSTWYLRRSRDRFKGNNQEDKQAALATLREVLLTLSKLMAPFTPFIAERIYLQLTTDNPQQTTDSRRYKESVHLEMWPMADESLIDKKVLDEMVVARKVVEMGLAIRAEHGVRVRQPLAVLGITGYVLRDEFKQIVADELNVKRVETQSIASLQGDHVAIKEDGALKVALDLNITDELKKEGLAREIVRTINQMRKDAKMTIQDRIVVEYSTEDELLGDVLAHSGEEIKKSVLANELKHGSGETEVEVDGRKMKVGLKKV